MIDRNSFVPLYHQVASMIKEQILSGQIKPGDKLPSESEMISHYKIGRLTVRDALKQLVNEGFLEKEQGKGTFCKEITEKKNIDIDVFLDMSDSYFIPYYVRSISEVLTKNNANFIISDTKDSDKEICSLIDKIIRKGSSGVILQPSHGLECEYKIIREAFQKLSIARIPYIMIDSIYEHMNASYLVIDEQKGGEIAFDYLTSLNHRNIAAIYVGKHKDSMMRLNGFLKRRKDTGNEEKINVTMIERDEKLEDVLAQVLLNKNAPTALFCYNDETAVRCLKKLRTMDIGVPNQVSIIGFDDSSIAENLMPPLTTIAHPKGVLGEFAVKALFDLINNRINWPYTKVFEPVLKVRESCKKID